MRTLVTGGAGFIGSNLATTLAADGRDVVVADTFAEGRWCNLVEFLKAGGDVVPLADPLDTSSLRKLGPFDSVFHQAATTGVIGADGQADQSGEAEHRILRNNIEGFRGVLDLAVEWGASVVWASSCSVYGRGPTPMREDAAYDPLNVYAFSKVAKEQLAARYASRLKFAPIGLRYSNAYGPNEDHKGRLASMVHQLAKQMRDGRRPRIFEGGEQRRDFVYVDDAVRANLLAESASREGRVARGEALVVNAGAGRSWSFNELVGELNAVLKTRLAPDYFANPFAFTQDHTETDGATARERIGYEALHDLASGVRAYAASGKLGVGA